MNIAGNITNGLLLALFSLLFSSCVSYHLTDNAHYNIKESSVRLIKNLQKDSLVQTSYEEAQHIAGKPCKLLTVTNTFDGLSPLGISIRLWADIVKPEKTTYYGDYPKQGLLDKIHSLKITLKGDNKELDITAFIKGDSSINSFIWRIYHSRKLGYSYYSSLNCNKLPYFPNTETLLHTLNNEASKLGRITNYDFIFWLDKSLVSSIDFKPSLLTMTMTLVDSSGKQFRTVNDDWKIE